MPMINSLKMVSWQVGFLKIRKVCISVMLKTRAAVLFEDLPGQPDQIYVFVDQTLKWVSCIVCSSISPIAISIEAVKSLRVFSSL